MEKESAKKVVEEVVNPDSHPLHIGNFLVVQYRDSSHRLAKIIEKLEMKHAPLVDDGAIMYKYYVHYVDFNRRMDEWITIDRIIKYPSEANKIELSKRNIHGPHHAVTTDHANKRGIDEIISSGGSLKKNISVTSTSSSSSNNRVRRSHRTGGNDTEGDTGDDTNIDQDDTSMSGPTTVAELEHDEHEGLDEQSLLEHEEITKIKNVENVMLGKHIMECWYFSPFPKEFTPDGPVDCLYFCEFTFRFFRTKFELQRYQNKPNLPRHPPGNEIYRDDNVSMFEVDGLTEMIYCQNLAYFAKLFLDHKTL